MYWKQWGKKKFSWDFNGMSHGFKTSFSSVWERTFVYGPWFQFQFCWKITQQMLCFPLLFSKSSVFSSLKHFVFWAVFPKQLNKETIWLPNKSCNLWPSSRLWLAGACYSSIHSVKEKVSLSDLRHWWRMEAWCRWLDRQQTLFRWEEEEVVGEDGVLKSHIVTVNLLSVILKPFILDLRVLPKWLFLLEHIKVQFPCATSWTSRVMWAWKSQQKGKKMKFRGHPSPECRRFCHHNRYCSKVWGQ